MAYKLLITGVFLQDITFQREHPSTLQPGSDPSPQNQVTRLSTGSQNRIERDKTSRSMKCLDLPKGSVSGCQFTIS